MGKRSKRYAAAAANIDPARLYRPGEALGLVEDTVAVSFDPTVELAVRLGIDPRKADQQVRGAVGLPHGTGKSVRVAVVADDPKAAEAQEAGADVVGADEVVSRIDADQLDFDAVIATPDQMGRMARYGKVLGPRGLMPNPKSGTVTNEVAEAVRAVKAGKVEFRTDRQGNVHSVLGKASFPVSALLENYGAVIEELRRLRPSAAKGRYLRSVHVTTSMGPSIPIDPNNARDLTPPTPAGQTAGLA
jgi:large subunit ribosomal protein L1